ncbi:hypothetical protein AAMO2058_000116400 [Amorphochlora amoebiformis]
MKYSTPHLAPTQGRVRRGHDSPKPIYIQNILKLFHTFCKQENIWRDLITEGGGEEWDSEGVKRGVWRELKSEIQTNFGNNLRNFGEINPIWRKSR